MIMIDFISARQRLRPRRTLAERFQELWFRFRLDYTREELEKSKKHEAYWLAEREYLRDILKSIGADPDLEVVPLTKNLNFWICVGLIVASLLAAAAFVGYREALTALIQARM